MLEFIVIGESAADAEIATCLAKRVLVEQYEWLADYLEDALRWRGLETGSSYSCWKDIRAIVDRAQLEQNYRAPRFLGHSRNKKPYKADGAIACKILNFIRFLQGKNSSIRAAIFIRDLDNQPDRREGLEQARQDRSNNTLEIAIATPNPNREAWVLNGWLAANSEEKTALAKLKAELTFDPCTESHRLRFSSRTGSDRTRDPKRVLARLTLDNRERERKCWQETSLVELRKRGEQTYLTAYLQEIKERLAPIFVSP